jgi:preprotein translocase subunit SecD
MIQDPNQGLSPTQAPMPAGYGYVPMAGTRSRKAILLALGFVGLLAVLVAGTVLVVTAGHKPTVSIVYQLVPADGQQVTTAQLDATVTVLRNRLNSAGIDGTVEKLPPDQVSVGVVRAADLTAVSGRLVAPGKLSFVLLPKAIYGDAMAAGDTPLPAAGETIDKALVDTAQFTGADLEVSKIYAAADPHNSGYWGIHFAFTGDAGTRFATWSGQHINEFFAIVLDQEVQSVPYIQSQITGGEGEITGAFTEAEAKSLAAVLQSGQLPVPLREISRTAAPSA